MCASICSVPSSCLLLSLGLQLALSYPPSSLPTLPFFTTQQSKGILVQKDVLLGSTLLSILQGLPHYSWRKIQILHIGSPGHFPLPWNLKPPLTEVQRWFLCPLIISSCDDHRALAGPGIHSVSTFYAGSPEHKCSLSIRTSFGYSKAGLASPSLLPGYIFFSPLWPFSTQFG